jgi:cell division protein FtsX
VIRLGLRLTLGGGRAAISRLAVIAVATSLGVGLLLSILAALNATATQNDRNAWLNTGRPGLRADTSAAARAADPLWWLLRVDSYDGEIIGRVDVAATGPTSPVPPGIPRLPGPGEYYASPALKALLSSTPAADLGDRYPGRQIGTIAAPALPGPSSLIAVVGHPPAELAKVPEAVRVTSIATISPTSCANANCVIGLSSNGVALILSVAGVALIFPVLILIGTATRLATTSRDQRFAAMRLVGATPRQISAISTVESGVAAVIGVGLGFALFYGLRPLLATVDLTGTPYYADDLALRLRDVLLIGLGIPVAAAIAARLALRRVQISPLGVTRRVSPSPPRPLRLIPLLLGLGELAFLIGRVPASTKGQIWTFVPGILLVMAGIVIAGPWLTMLGARLLARRTNRPAVLVAGRRLGDDPKGGFRAVSGLVLALCVTSTTLGVISALAAEDRLPRDGEAVRGSVIADFDHGRTASGQPRSPQSPLPATTRAELEATPGVLGLTEIHTNPLGLQDPTDLPGQHPYLAGLASCSQLATTPVYRTCLPGAAAAAVPASFRSFGYGPVWPAHWPAAAISAERLDRLPVTEVVVVTNGTRTAIERTRTVLSVAYPQEEIASAVKDDNAWLNKGYQGYRRLADVVLLVTFPIAACSLAVSVAGGLSERKRPFSLLRLAGVQLGVLRRVVLLETAVPLLVVAAVAIGTGYLAAQLFLQAQYGYSVRPPGVGYYGVVLGGLAVSLAVIGATLPVLRRITGPQTARNE